jgi:hypothetical protein
MENFFNSEEDSKEEQASLDQMSAQDEDSNW